MAAVDPKKYLAVSTGRAYDFFVKDFKALPAEKHDAKTSDGVRTPRSVILECADINGRVAEFLKTDEFPAGRSDEERQAFHETLTTCESVLGYLDKQTSDLLSALEGVDENILGDTTNKFFGMPMTYMEIASLPASHMMYHDGQLCFMQTVYGDHEMHWW